MTNENKKIKSPKSEKIDSKKETSIKKTISKKTVSKNDSLVEKKPTSSKKTLLVDDNKIDKKNLDKKVSSKSVKKDLSIESKVNSDKTVKKEDVKNTSVKKTVSVKEKDKKVDDITKSEKSTSVKKTVSVKEKNKKTDDISKTKKPTSLNGFLKFNLLKNTFSDISFLYKNIIHWNISKLLIFIYSILIGLISTIPFLLIFLIGSFFSELSFLEIISGLLNGQTIFNSFGNALYFLMIFIFFIIFSYSNILLMRLNNSYIDGKIIEYKDKEYLNIKKICKYLKLSLLNISILLVPGIIFLLLVSILLFISGGLDKIQLLVSSGFNNYFSILSLIFFIITVISIVYIGYRIIFSYLILSDENNYDEKKNVLTYTKESFIRTKSFVKFMKFLGLIVLFLIVIAPVSYTGKVIENNNILLSDYNNYLYATQEMKDALNDKQVYYYESLKTEFGSFSTEDINTKMNYNSVYYVLFTVLNFVFLYGLSVMIFSSFYRRELV